MPREQLNLLEMLLLKEENENTPLLIFQTEELQFIFKPLTPIDYMKAKTLTNNDEELHDTICQICVIKPNEYDFAYSTFPGVSTNAAKEIIKFSMLDDFTTPLNFLEAQRLDIETDFLTKCILFVKSSFPEYTYEEIKEWDYYKIMKHTAMSEFISTLKGVNYKLEFNLEEIEKNKNASIDIEKRNNNLIDAGVDPMLYMTDAIRMKKRLIDTPIILGVDWQDDESISENLSNIYKAREYNYLESLKDEQT